MRNSLRFIAVAASILLSTGLIGGTAFAAPAPTTAPDLVSPQAGSLVVTNMRIIYVLPDTPAAGSVMITLTRTSPATPSFARTFNMSNDQMVDISVNIFATPSSILIQHPNTISGISPSSELLPVGIYTVSLSYQNAAGGTAATVAHALVTLTVPCAAGAFSNNGNVPVGSSCTEAPVGKFVSATGATSAENCPAGTFTLNLGSANCTPAPAGKFSAAGTGGLAPSECAVGTYQELSGQASCLSAPANFYVATTGATSATACPATYTSPVGSDASSDCIAPVVSQTPTVVAAPATKALPTLAKGKKMRIRTLATQIEMSLPARSKATAKVAKSSRKICRVSGNSIRALRKGNCVVTVKVKPRKGSATTKATTITVN